MSVAVIEQQLARWQTAFSAEDCTDICALYAADANLWGTLSSTRRDSAALIRQYFDNLFNYPERRVELVEHHVRIIDQTAISSGIYRFHWRNGQSMVTTDARFSIVFIQLDGEWLIIEHHSSVLPPVA